MIIINDIRISAVSENAILLEWPEKICPIQHQQIMQCQSLLTQSFKALIIDTVAAYNSLMVYYHFEKIVVTTLFDKLQTLLAHLDDNDTQQNALKPIIIPVYYGEDAGWDLLEVAKRLSISIEDLIACHTKTSYQAYALGFTPGFCYLGQLDKKLQLPRRASPRIKIPRGAVAIAEQQTAVYPNTSPGGWHIIGQTPIEMFTCQQDNFVPTISVGQKVQFKAIDRQTFNEMGGKVECEN